MRPRSSNNYGVRTRHLEPWCVGGEFRHQGIGERWRIGQERRRRNRPSELTRNSFDAGQVPGGNRQEPCLRLALFRNLMRKSVQSLSMGWLHALKSNFSRWAWIKHQGDLTRTSRLVGIAHQSGETIIREHRDRRWNRDDSQWPAMVNCKSQYSCRHRHAQRSPACWPPNQARRWRRSPHGRTRFALQRPHPGTT